MALGVFIMSWGPLFIDLLHSELSSRTFTQATIQLKQSLERYFQASLGGKQQKEALALTRDCLTDLFRLTDSRRQLRIIEALQEIISHHTFPIQALPSWARPQGGGTWRSVRQVLSTDIRDLFQPPRSSPLPLTKKETERHLYLDASPLADEDNTTTGAHEASLADKLNKELSLENTLRLLEHEFHIFPRPRNEKHASLVDKLNQDVTIDNILAVLSHQFHIFPKKENP